MGGPLAAGSELPHWMGATNPSEVTGPGPSWPTHTNGMALTEIRAPGATSLGVRSNAAGWSAWAAAAAVVMGVAVNTSAASKAVTRLI
jgi:hypothetical protein